MHHLRLNLLVHDRGDEAHIYPEQSRMFNGLIDTNGEVYRILSDTSVEGMTVIRRMEKLEVEKAIEIMEAAVKLKKHLHTKAQ